MKLLYEKSQPGRRASAIPHHEGLPEAEVPASRRRAEPPRLPEVPEFELVRHFTELSTRNFGVDTGFYPLGSCTMKYNPRINERLVALPGFASLHPLQEAEGAQGALELMGRLPEILAAVTDAVDRANQRLSKVEQIKKFKLLPAIWLPDTDELTPTMKLKRKPIAAKYEAEIDAMYA